MLNADKVLKLTVVDHNQSPPPVWGSLNVDPLMVTGWGSRPDGTTILYFGMHTVVVQETVDQVHEQMQRLLRDMPFMPPFSAK